MSRRLTTGLVFLRATAVAAVLLLLWNPAWSRPRAGGTQPLVLLDASLSMAGRGSNWRQALDTARALAREGAGDGLIWRFGADVAAFDSGAPADGATLVRPALEAAAARGGPVTLVTDGAVTDARDLPEDLRRRPRVIVVPRADFSDGFLASVTGPRRVGARDTIRLVVSYGTAGNGERGRGNRVVVAVTVAGRRLATREVTLPDRGTLSTEIMIPASSLPAGWSALEARLEGAADEEPRDDARLFVVEVSPAPAAVILAAPPDWETRFLSRTLAEVARVPVRTFVAAETNGVWRDAVTLAPVAAREVQRALDAARLVVLAGDPLAGGSLRVPSRAGVLLWPPPPPAAPARPTAPRTGDWYVQPPPPSPLTGMLAGLAWDSLPPADAIAELAADSGTVALTARLARRGAPVPVITLRNSSGVGRRATVGAGGLWRWSFRGGAASLAYRSLVASLVDWLLGGGAGSAERFVPVTFESPNGLPLIWQWTGAGAPADVVIQLRGDVAADPRVDTLHFDVAGRAALHLPPGQYRYAAAESGRSERGLVAVETYSDEWRPAPSPAALTGQPGVPAQGRESVGLRDRWWLFAIAIAALAGEWAWRRRMGLP